MIFINWLWYVWSNSNTEFALMVLFRFWIDLLSQSNEPLLNPHLSLSSFSLYTQKFSLSLSLNSVSLDNLVCHLDSHHCNKHLNLKNEKIC